MRCPQCCNMARMSHSHRADQNVGWNFLADISSLRIPVMNGNISVFGEEAMWMRSCAVCKALMVMLRLRDSVRCRCGWEWSGRGDPNWRIAVDQDAGILQDEGEAVMARVIEFYIPTNFRRKVASVPPQSQPGKVIEFCLLAKKSA
jgi:hypothetical protein